jgi:hypothetical protein
MREFSMILVAAFAAPALCAAPVKLTATLSGPAEVPGPGAEQGKGSAEVTLDADKGQVCTMLMASGTDAPTMAHIHKGEAGVAGGVVVPLTAPTNGMSQGCSAVAADVIGAIAANPQNYYVNVHSAAFPKGAIRGQLGK